MDKTHSTTRKRRRTERPGRPACPGWLDSEAKEVWRRTSVLMGEMGILTRADAGALARYCQTFVRWKQAEQFLQKHGMVYPVKSGTGVTKCVFAWPQVGIAQKLSALLAKLENALGLTPASREKMNEVFEYFDDPDGELRAAAARISAERRRL